MKNNLSSKNIVKMDKRQVDFLKNQFEIYDNHGITYVSTNMTITYDDEKDKLKKKIESYPTTEDFEKGIETNLDLKKNSSIVPTGEMYNLIVFDIDNKGDTIKNFDKFVEDNDVNVDTLTIKTINDGFHYYFKPSKEQKEILKDFKSSLGSVLGLDIDVKYNNGFVFGVSKVTYNTSFKKYKITNDTKVRTLPDTLFQELTKTFKKKGNKNETKTQKTNEEPIQESDEDNRLLPYLDIYKKYIKTRDEWIKIGTIIYNEGGSIKLFDDFSKSFPDLYDEDGLKKTWKGIKKSNNKCNLHTLKNMIDSKMNDGRKTIYDMEIKDTKGIINNMYEIGMVTDTHIAQIFYSLNQNNFMYLSEVKKWYSINNYGIWEEEGDENMKARQLINSYVKSYLLNDNKDRLHKAKLSGDIEEEEHIIKMYKSLNTYVNKTINKKSVISELASLYEKTKIYEQLDNKNPYLFGFLNGVYDLKNDEFRNAQPDELITCTTGYNYQRPKTIKRKIVEDIFNGIFPDEKECAYIKKVLSLGLLADNPLEEFYVFIGTGSNGKGVLSTLTKALLGHHFDTLDIEYLSKSAQNNSKGADPIMARKKNVRLVITSEPESSIKLREGKLKELSGRDTIQCRNLYQESFNFTPYFKLIIQTNWSPEIDGSDMGMKRRLRLIHFPNSFVENPVKENERKIDHRVKSEYPKDEEVLNAYFSILLESFQELMNDNFKLEFPDRFKMNTDNFFMNNDPTGEYLKTSCDIIDNANTKSADLYNSFVEYCADNNFDKISHKKFSEILSNKGYVPKKKTTGMIYTTLKIKEPKEDV